MTDPEIIDLFFERSEQAIIEISKKHGSPVIKVAYNILGNLQDTEECVNDTWLATWNSVPPQIPEKLRTFVCKIARNLATKKYHSNSAEKRNSQYDLALDELAECIPDIDTVEDAYSAKELAMIINHFLDTLSYEDKFIFMRRYWYADSLTDIVQMTNMSYSSISVRLHRTKTKLKNLLTKEGVLV